MDESAAAKSPAQSTQCLPGGKPCFSGFSAAMAGGLADLGRNLNVVAGAAILLAVSFLPIIGEKGANRIVSDGCLRLVV